MDAKLATLDDLLSGLGDGEITPFQSCARYYEPMDCVIYLKEDLPYRADRVDAFLTLLWHPHEEKALGVKLKGFRWLFQRWQALCDSGNVTVPAATFIPLIKAIELALTARLGEILTRAAEEDRLGGQERLAEQQKIEGRYRQAREIVDSLSVTVDARDLVEAA